MSLSPVKKQILETLCRSGKPMNAAELAKETKAEPQQVRGHLLGLLKLGYVTQPEKAVYTITQKGKETLSQPTQQTQLEITKEKAEAILAYAPHDRAFHFYAGLGQPLNLHAHGLRDFANKVERADVASVQFHMSRGDFEAWFHSLGDDELAKKIGELRKGNLVGEALRTQIHELVEQRYIALAKVAGQTVYPE